MVKSITLIGMMGSGKTTVAKELNKLLPDFRLVDIDEDIEKTSGKKISEIFLKYGEQHFRELEAHKIKHYSSGENLIISAGGGVFENPSNRKVLLNNTNVVYLKASAGEIYNRIKQETHRPLLKENFSIQRISDILDKREKNYQKAHFQVVTDKKTPTQISQEIIGLIND